MVTKINDNGVERDMTNAEQSAYLVWATEAQAEAQAQTDAQTAKAVARRAVLDKLGLTADEASALFG